jgi:hypothetical protein
MLRFLCWFLRRVTVFLFAAGVPALAWGGPGPVILSEIHYHPLSADEGALEFVELRNLGTADVDLTGWSFREGIGFIFPAGSVVPARGYLVVSPDPARARAAYGLEMVAGPYSSRLDNGGEVISLVDAAGRVANRLRYGAGDVWPSLPDGFGPSLEFTGDDDANDLHFRWAASRVLGGTPGARNSRAGGAPASAIRGILNEARAAEGAPGGFIELFNPTASPWSAADHLVSFGGGRAARLPAGAPLPPGGLRAFTAEALGFEVPAADGILLLLAPDGKTLIDALELRVAPAGRSVGRHPDGDDDIFVLDSPTPGASNRYAFESPVVINEIHYHPPFVPPGGGCARRCSDPEQWLELWNRSAGEVNLTGWRLTKGIDFAFAPDTRIAPGAALVVAASLATFRARHPGVAAVGDWTGRLARDADTINLRDPLGNRADHVHYGDGGPLNDEEPLDGADDRTFRASLWPAGPDGSGHTLELVNPDLENRSGLAWRASSSPGGTPGSPNSVLAGNPRPTIDGVRHQPAVPRAGETVRVTCAIASLDALVAATLEWAPDGGAARQVALRDDGVDPDERTGDGVYSGTIPPRADGEVITFRITARDASGNSAAVPLPPEVPPYPGFEGPFFLYRVEDLPPPANGQATYRIVMRQQDLEQLQDRDLISDVLLPVTFIAGEEVHHLTGLRYRGETSRREPNRSYRLEFPAEAPFDGVDDLNLNGSNGGDYGASNTREIISAGLFRRAGAPYPQTFPINLRFPVEVARDYDSRYVRKENYDEHFLGRYFGGSDQGNLYRGMNPGGVGSENADLQYLGEDPTPYRPLYEKRTNAEEDDYSDIMQLTRTFDPVETPDELFASDLERLIDAREWAQFFAMQALLSNNDGGIWTDNGEDYFLYRVPVDSARPDAGKFLLLSWDQEESIRGPNEPLFRPEVPAVRRFLTHPRFARLYHDELKSLKNGPFSRPEIHRRLGFIEGMFSAAEAAEIAAGIADVVAARIAFVDFSVPSHWVAGPLSRIVGGTSLIAPGDEWRFFRGTEAPAGGPSGWTQRGYNHSSWETGATGIGYGDDDDATVLDDMEGNYTTVYARKTFTLPDPAAVAGLTLEIDYDDAFVAYLNGVEVARSSSAPGDPGEPVPFLARATETREAGIIDSYDLPLASVNLVTGTNVLAIVVLNERDDSSDLSLIPALLMTALTGGGEAGGCGGLVFATGPEVTLGGVADPALGSSVTVNGTPAAAAFITSGGGPYGLRWNAVVPLVPGDNRVVLRTHEGESGLGAATSSEEITVRRIGRAFTAVGGPLAGNVTWTAAGGPYRLTASVDVPPGASLAIESGAVVLAGSDMGITVRGRLDIDATPGAPALFMPRECDRPWGGISFEATGSAPADPAHSLRGAVFLHAQGLPNAGAVIAANAASLRVEECEFRALRNRALRAADGRLEVRSSVFAGVPGGVAAVNSAAQILDSSFRDVFGIRPAIALDGGSERSQVARVSVEGAGASGIALTSTSADLTEIILRGGDAEAFAIAGSGTPGATVLSGNVASGWVTGLGLGPGALVTGDHNTLACSQVGVRLSFADGLPEPRATFHSLIVWDNLADVEPPLSSALDISFSDVGGGLLPGAGNISVPPRFVAAHAADFSLAAGSPCIGSGKDGTDMGAISHAGGFLFIRGDADPTGGLNISDPIRTLGVLFLGGSGPDCFDILDANDDGAVNITDPIYILLYLFQGGSPPPPPLEAPGPDPTPDGLACP